MASHNLYRSKAELELPAHRLWSAVIEQAINEAVRTVRKPKVIWEGAWKRYQGRMRARADARQFFRHRKCDVILTAMGVDVDWFIGRLKERYPEVFNA